MVFDSDFENNKRIYLYYSALDAEVGDNPYSQLLRFTVEGDTIDPDSEVTMREECCHVGGDLVFDLDGNLLISTGDDIFSRASSGYAPLDEREGPQVRRPANVR